MGWFGNNDKDDLKKNSNEEAEDEESDDEEGDGDEDDEPEKKCTFQYSWDFDDEAWNCDLTNENVYCDKTKCPFWKK